MKIDELIMLVQAGYSKDEISSMIESKQDQKPNTTQDQKPDTIQDQKLNTIQEQKPDTIQDQKPDTKKEFDYDKLADLIIAKIQANNRSANLNNNINSTEDWLSQLSLKF